MRDLRGIFRCQELFCDAISPPHSHTWDLWGGSQDSWAQDRWPESRFRASPLAVPHVPTLFSTRGRPGGWERRPWDTSRRRGAAAAITHFLGFPYVFIRPNKPFLKIRDPQLPREMALLGTRGNRDSRGSSNGKSWSEEGRARRRGVRARRRAGLGPEGAGRARRAGPT